MSYMINVYSPDKWDLYADCTFYPTVPKKCQPLYKWARDTGADIASNLCYFNFMSSKQNPGYTIQYLRIPRLGGDCGYGSNSTRDQITLPNGDVITGWSTTKEPAIKDNVIIDCKGLSVRPHNAVGLTMDGRFFVVQNRYNTPKQVAQHTIAFLQKYYGTGVHLMLWEDGGGSVGTYSSRADMLYAPQKEGTFGRSVCSVICAKYREGSPKINRTLKKGCQGSDVKLLQMFLLTEADGIFGSGTRNKVMQFQKQKGLAVDGIAGPITLGKLGLY